MIKFKYDNRNEDQNTFSVITPSKLWVVQLIFSICNKNWRGFLYTYVVYSNVPVLNELIPQRKLCENDCYLLIHVPGKNHRCLYRTILRAYIFVSPIGSFLILIFRASQDKGILRQPAQHKMHCTSLYIE